MFIWSSIFQCWRSCDPMLVSLWAPVTPNTRDYLRLCDVSPTKLNSRQNSVNSTIWLYVASPNATRKCASDSCCRQRSLIHTYPTLTHSRLSTSAACFEYAAKLIYWIIEVILLLDYVLHFHVADREDLVVDFHRCKRNNVRKRCSLIWQHTPTYRVTHSR